MTVTLQYDTKSATSSPEPLFTRCCCCIPLRVGCFILGYLNLVFNTIHTLMLLAMAIYLGITSHGFDHIDKHPIGIPADKYFLVQLATLLILILCINFTWLITNIACLVGLHKNRPGPIRVYVGVATARLIIFLAILIYLTVIGMGINNIVTYSVDIGSAAYFILVYYIYAGQLERKKVPEPEISNIKVSDIAFVYPTKIDKQTLVA
ncbi:uncharacterized protein [Epargyreus clarus]|uniref:uncharacterized protein isoform X1 n=1 Tax=Epargyreus clarus TaxID=520877 RepID=UPI003C2AF54C